MSSSSPQSEVWGETLPPRRVPVKEEADRMRPGQGRVVFSAVLDVRRWHPREDA